MSLEERYGKLAAAGSTMPPLALCSLAAVCRKNGFETAIIDAVCRQITADEIIEQIVRCQARYVGITAMTCGIHSAAQIARKVKQRDAGIQTLIGGPHITALPIETMQMFPEFDVGFIGEAEETLIDYLTTTGTGRELKNVKGIVFRQNSNINLTDARPFIENLDSLPFPAWDLLPGFPGTYTPAAIRCKKLPASHLVTSRGCPMKCTFCDRSVFGNRYRFFSVEYVFEMIKILHVKFGVKDILFEDDSFTLQKSRVVALCELIAKNRFHFSWSCLGRVDTVDKELLTIMKKAGCWQIGFGIESGNTNVLESVEKKTNLKKIRDALTLTKKSGIHTKGFFIAGLPHETQESIRETIRLATSADLDDISVSFCTPFPGTVLNEKARSFGEFDPDWKKMNLMNAVFVPHGLSKKQLEDYHSRFLRSFYFRPRIILDYFLRSVHDFRVFFRLMRGMLTFVSPVKPR
jgi:anaerobic magnesium-protoporphyrin IX monomethyl ester cyclase